MALDKQDLSNLIEFLDRAPIKGHNERAAMNKIIKGITDMASDIVEEETKNDKKQEHK